MNLTKQKTDKGYETITIGQYNISDLAWRVLDEDDEKMLVISEKVLEFIEMKRDNYCEECRWKNTFLRSLINRADMVEEMMVDEELAHIIPDEDGDIFFLLTREQLEKYLPTAEDRRATELVNKNGYGIYEDFLEEFDPGNGVIFRHYESKEGYLPYWTSTLYCNEGEGYAEIVYGDGEFEEELCSQICGIRPAMWVKK